MVKKYLTDTIEKTLKELGIDEPVNFNIDSPPDPKMGDFATNVAMVLSQKNKQSPKEFAEKIVEKLNTNNDIESEIAGPGFINIHLKDEIYFKELQNILKLKDNYGKQEIGNGKKINVEFISANPTGPIHIGNARGGPIGEALANLYEWQGYKVDREFYINDIGGQIDKLGESIYYWYEKTLGENPKFPEDGYPGDYVKSIFDSIYKEKKEEIESIKEKDDCIDFFKHEGVKKVVERIEEDSKLLGIEFDNWINQSQFEDSGKSNQIIQMLEDRGATVKKEGALWYKSPNESEVDRESVLQKSDDKSTLTYFADDIAYHKDKLSRGYEKIIDVWGSNHHGHIMRLKNALNSLGLDSDKLEVILYQFVRLKNGDEILKMGKRTGNIINIKDVVEAGVSPDAFKYFILSQNSNTPIDFDFKLAKDTSEKNPVYYIQYAHARICSILKKSEDRGDTKIDFSLLSDPKEKALYKELTKFTEIMQEIAQSFQIQSLPHFAYKIASLFHDFYANCQVLCDDKELQKARLALASSCKIVLKNALEICDISTPERM